MKNKFVDFIKNFFRALSANVLRIVITFVLTLLLPKILGQEEYGFWQLYLFYVTYASYSSLGWCEGIYLKYGGKDYHTLDKQAIAGQVWSLAIYEVFFNIIAAIVVSIVVPDPAKKLILYFAFISAFLDIIRYILQNLLQSTNRIKEYARLVTAERLLFFGFAILFICIGSRDYVFFIYSELLARLISLIYALIMCRDVVFVKLTSPREIVDEAKELVGCGFKLLFASLASQLIIGIVRFAVEQEWGTIVFGKISLTLSMSNMLITCISAVSVVLFPVLKKMDDQRLSDVYSVMRMVLTVPVYGVLLVYVPARLILSLWLPQYAESLKYLAVLFPICVYEIRSSVLINTYFKAYRKENLILYINVITVALSLFLTFITVGVMKNLDLTVIIIVVLMLFKCVLSEILLKPLVGGNIWRDLIQEFVLTAVFVVSSWYISDYKATLCYGVVYMLYLLLNKKDIGKQLTQMKQIIRK